MPTYDYLCPVHGEFEEVHSITTVLTHCPKCKEDGNDTEVKRLISCATPGTVELTGQELIDKVKSDTQQLKKDMQKSDKVYANMLGESRYHDLQTRMDRRKKR
jgi:putative FmdB family regulatory protein